MDQEFLDKINVAMDEAMLAFQADENIIFHQDKKHRMKYQYRDNKELKNWKKKQKCIVNNCGNKSIENSHTIQKSGSIKEISENGHVLTPKFNKNKGEVEMVPIGINEASTFPGYCKNHENLFQGFENSKDFQFENHVSLQLYRTVCKEIVVNEHQISFLLKSKKAYIDYRNKRFEEMIIKNLGEDLMSEHNCSLIDIKMTRNDGQLYRCETLIKSMTAYLEEFLYPYRDNILNDLSKKKFQKIAYKTMLFDELIPVAIAGGSNFYIKLKTKSKNVRLIMNVLPLNGKTYIFLSTLRKFKKELEEYSSQFENPLSMITLLESWMIYGCDHWFITPSVWNKIDSRFQREILDSILDTSFNAANKFGLTIFNDFKNLYFDLAEKNASEIDESLLRFIEKEKKKATDRN